MKRSAISNSLIGETIVKKEVKKEAEEEGEEPELVVPDHRSNHSSIINGSRGIKRSPTQSDEIDTSKYLEMVCSLFLLRLTFNLTLPLCRTGTVHKLWQYRYLSDSVSFNSRGASRYVLLKVSLFR